MLEGGGCNAVWLPKTASGEVWSKESRGRALVCFEFQFNSSKIPLRFYSDGNVFVRHY